MQLFKAKLIVIGIGITDYYHALKPGVPIRFDVWIITKPGKLAFIYHHYLN